MGRTEFGKRVKHLLVENDMTQTELANEIGVTRVTVCNMLSKKTPPSTKTLCEISDVFGVSTDYLLGRTDNLERI